MSFPPARSGSDSSWNAAAHAAAAVGAPFSLTRRKFLQSAGALAGSPLLAHAAQQTAAPAAEAPAAATLRIALQINGEQHELMLEP
ncbi:MAG TPA: hypothetical protein VL051_04705, partial [Burkholderiaceae bacterium]|nr:hypothetical protein [Burkholderiaceae bacterium]